MVFPVVMHGCEKSTIKKAECWRVDAFELWCWRRPLRAPRTARRLNRSILKEISPGCSLEGLLLKLNLQYFGHLMGRADSLEKTWCWKSLKVRGEGDNRGWDIWMASQTQWTWVCAKVGSWCWTGSPRVLWFMGLQRVGNDWGTELNWTDRNNSQHCLVNPDSILLNQKARLVTYELLGVIFVVIGERLTTVVFQVRSWIANLSFES